MSTWGFFCISDMSKKSKGWSEISELQIKEMTIHMAEYQKEAPVFDLSVCLNDIPDGCSFPSSSEKKNFPEATKEGGMRVVDGGRR